MKLQQIMGEARACRACSESLPHGCRPLVQGTNSANILIIGQAPGLAAHKSGIPWDDRSGQRLREWLGLSNEQFYDAGFIAQMPMGFCYPGTGSSGDLRPRAECAPLWHGRMLDALDQIKLTIYTGRYAFDEYLSDSYSSLTESVSGWSSLLPDRISLPHPSPRNNIWLRRHRWFLEDVVPALQARVRSLVSSSMS